MWVGRGAYRQVKYDGCRNVSERFIYNIMIYVMSNKKKQRCDYFEKMKKFSRNSKTRLVTYLVIYVPTATHL